MPRPRLVSGQLALVLLSTLGTLTSFYLLLSVMPMYASSAGAGSTGAGLVTGVLLLGTVAAELVSSLLMKRHGYRIVLAAGAVLMGVPALALLSPRPLIIVAAVSVVRGFGFGLSTVVLGALTASLVPPERRGEGIGLLGIADTLPGVVALPAGVWLAGNYGYPVVVGLAAATALVPLAAFAWLPGRADGRWTPGRADAEQPTGMLAGLRHGGLLPLSVIFAASTVTAGVVASFLPLVNGIPGNIAAAGLLTQALAATICQWWAGRLGDRHGHARLLNPGLALGSLGMIAMIWLTSPAVLITGMCLFGAGFGLILNATFVLMIDRMPASAVGTASAGWSLAYDVGYGAGPVLFGLIVGHTGYPAAFALTSVVMLAAVPLARREHSAGADKPARAPVRDARRLADSRCQ
jgi:MFS family permease